MAETKKLSPLDEVRLAAKYNYFKNLRDKEERERLAQLKDEGNLEVYVEGKLAELKKARQGEKAEDVQPEKKGK